jgi:hypothetical protein
MPEDPPLNVTNPMHIIKVLMSIVALNPSTVRVLNRDNVFALKL